tara:strand:- start:142 stop:363 length:222 start_codon:yes stop_codon:yes gene_type:complete
MKELLKLIPVLGLTTLMSLALGCPSGGEVGDDTPPGDDPEAASEEEPANDQSEKEKAAAQAIADQLKGKAGKE